jgi:hypothetical protein
MEKVRVGGGRGTTGNLVKTPLNLLAFLKPIQPKSVLRCGLAAANTPLR